jgi:hypothetical protein
VLLAAARRQAQQSLRPAHSFHLFQDGRQSGNCHFHPKLRWGLRKPWQQRAAGSSSCCTHAAGSLGLSSFACARPLDLPAGGPSYLLVPLLPPAAGCCSCAGCALPGESPPAHKPLSLLEAPGRLTGHHYRTAPRGRPALDSHTPTAPIPRAHKAGEAGRLPL